jgi:hypothetical protein
MKILSSWLLACPRQIHDASVHRIREAQHHTRSPVSVAGEESQTHVGNFTHRAIPSSIHDVSQIAARV